MSLRFTVKLTLTLILLFVVYFNVAALIDENRLGFCINTSESLPQKLFVRWRSHAKPERGVYVSFFHPMTSEKLAKQVVGIPGDTIQVHARKVLVNGQSFGTCLEKSPRSGKLYTPIESGVIPEGFVFVHAPHIESFDSRYREFGLVSIASLREVLCPVF